jgi:SIR2-like protein
MDPSEAPSEPSIPKELCQEFARRRVVLFIGAGVSMAVDAPGWEQLVARLFEGRNVDPARLNRLSLDQRVSYFLRNYGGRPELRDILRGELETHRDLEVHRALVSLPVELILTTNYDPNLERAAQQLKPYEVISYDREVPHKFGTKSLTIIHLYGNTDDFLASEEDLVNFEREHPALSAILQQVLLTRTVFFLGFSLRDHNVLNHVLRTHAMVRAPTPGDFAPKHYAHIIDDDQSVLEDLWDSRRLKIIRSPTGKDARATSLIFRAFVHTLARKVAELSYDEIEREAIIEREERDFFWRFHANGSRPLMRRESTFSVLSLPDAFAESGLKQRSGHDLGLKRKDLYLRWMQEGELKMILNCQPRYWEDIRGYRSPAIVAERLQRVKQVVLSQLENPRFVFGIRRHPTGHASFASLGSDVLLYSESPRAEEGEGIAYKTSNVVRDTVAIQVFNLCFDRELEDLMRDVDPNFGSKPTAEQIRLLKGRSLEIIDGLRARLGGGGAA